MSRSAHTADHLVIGGGLAGSMVAMRLAAAGREVTLLERERAAHHKVCGEFLSREALEYLELAGVRPLDLGAKTIRFVRLSSGQRVAQAALPFPALSLSRSVLDEALLKRATEAGCAVVGGAHVEGLAAQDGLWRIDLRGGESWRAPQVFLANGKHDLRGWERKPGPHGDLVGFKMHWRLTEAQTAAQRDFIELFLFPGGYGGMSLVEGDAANFCFVVRRATLRAKPHAKGGWAELLASILDENPHISERLRGAAPLWERPLAVSAIPYGYLSGRPFGLWCVGDQAAVIPSFTGDGMSIALHSGALAAQMFLAGQSAEQYHQMLCSHLKRGMGLARWLSRAMVSGAGRMLAPLALSLFPGAISWIARSTRIHQASLIQHLEKLPEPHQGATQ
jgi:flavin-dependent dehydrogenase